MQLSKDSCDSCRSEVDRLFTRPHQNFLSGQENPFRLIRLKLRSVLRSLNVSQWSFTRTILIDPSTRVSSTSKEVFVVCK